MSWLDGSLLPLGCILTLLFILRSYRAKPSEQPEIAVGRTPILFKYPTIEPSSVDLSDLKPVPYRPFKWGQYHVTMGIRSMPWDTWVEIDNQLPRYHDIRLHRIQTRGEDAIRVLPANLPLVDSAYQGCVELVHELAEFLHQRYPTVYTVERDGAEAVKTINVLPIRTSYTLPLPLAPNPKAPTALRSVSKEEAEAAINIAALITQDDLAVMVEGADGQYYFQAGAICIPGSWRISDKIGRSLEEIHIEGGVPQYRQKLHVGMERFFRRLAIDKPVVRNNYSIQIVPSEDAEETANFVDPEELGWSATMNGPEPAFDDNARAHPPAKPVVAPGNIRLRSERQSLRRLPLTGVVIFGIRTYVFKVEELANEPGVAARLANAVRSWPDDVQDYKGKKLYADVLLEYLDKRATEDGDVHMQNEFPF